MRRTAWRGARLARRGTGSPVDQDEPNHLPGVAGLGGAPGEPGGTRSGLPARARRRGAARPGRRPGRRSVGGDAMTALTVPASLEEDASLRPVPWRRMAWVTWRQHRIALAGVAAFVGALAGWLGVAGLLPRPAHAAAAPLPPGRPARPDPLRN